MFYASQHYMNYASVKARGVKESDSKYTLTVHKNPVKKSGYEFASELKKRDTYDSVKLYLSDGDSDAEYYDIERFNNSIIRSKGTVVQLVANNPWEYFVTLTVSPESHADRYNLKDCSKKLRKFFNNYKNRCAPDFKYLVIPEEHKEKGWHFHGVLMGVNPDDMVVNKNGYLDFKPYVERFGFFSMGKYGKVRGKGSECKENTDICSLGKIKDIKKCANYISKYISKEMFIGEQMAVGNHLYFASKGLKKDTLIIIGEPVVDPKEFLEKGYDGFDNEHCTKVEFEKKDEAVKCVKPFAPDFKKGVSLSAYGDKLPLTKEKRQRLVRKAVSKFCNEFGMRLPSSQSGIEALWSEIMEKYCYVLNDYDRIKENRQHLRFIAKRFVEGLLDDGSPCPFTDAEPPPNLSPEYENISLLE